MATEGLDVRVRDNHLLCLSHTLIESRTVSKKFTDVRDVKTEIHRPARRLRACRGHAGASRGEGGASASHGWGHVGGTA